MAVEYTPIVLERLHELVRCGLAKWSLSPHSDIRLLNASENATYRVDDPASGRCLAVRVHREGYHSESEIRSELAWISALREAAVVDTPAPVAASDGALACRLSTPDGAATRFAVAFEFVPGREPDSSHDLVGWFRELGAITARMHQHAKTWRRAPSFTRKTWDFDLMLGKVSIWGRWQDGVELDDKGRALLARAVICLEKRLQRYGAGPDRFGLIHADLRLANLLVDGQSMRVIDFDDCGFSWFIYDFAAAVSFFETDPIVPALAAAWAEGYRTVAPLSPEEEFELPVFVMLRQILLVAWIATHQHSPFGGEPGIRYTHDTLRSAESFLRRFS